MESVWLSLIFRKRSCTEGWQFLRYYEDKGYIAAPGRIVCGDRAYRRYSAEHIKLLQEIKSYLDQGFSLKGAVRISRKNLKTGGDSNGN